MPIYNFVISFFIEFGPATAFLFSAIYFDFFTAVKVLLAATVLSILTSLYRDKKVPIFSLIVSIVVILSGTLTLYFQNPYFTVIEFTLYNLFFALAAVIGYAKDGPIMKFLFGSMFSMTDKGWHILSLRWAGFFVLLAIGNEISWNFYGEQVWIYFRIFAILLTAIFGFYQLTLTKKERLENASTWGLRIYK